MNIKTFLTAGLVAGGIYISGAEFAAPTQTTTTYLADYGSNETAEIAGQDARDAGVRHDSDVQHHRAARHGEHSW